MIAAACTLVVGFVGCEGSGGPGGKEAVTPPPDPTPTTVSDSAGIRIVDNGPPERLPSTEWRLSGEPDLVVGVADGDVDHMLDRVTGVVSHGDGGIAVADLASSQVRFFDREGRFLASVGSKGEGPGEFRQILGLVRIPGDSLGVIDARRGVMVFDSEGVFGRAVAIGPISGDVHPLIFQESPRSGRVVGVLEEGGLVTLDSDGFSMGQIRDAREPLQPDLNFRFRGGDGTEDRALARLPGRSYPPDGVPMLLSLLFGPDVYASTSGDLLVLAIAESGELRWIDREGALRQVARRAWPHRPVTEAMIEANRLASVPPLSTSMWSEGMSNVIVNRRVAAEVLPPFSALLVDSGGNTWVRHYEVSHADLRAEFIRTFPDASTWSVFDSDGVLLGEVEMPPSFTPLEIGDGYVLGLARSDLGVEQVRRYVLEKP